MTFKKNQFIYKEFEWRAAENPAACALISADPAENSQEIAVTYRELKEKAELTAMKLEAEGLKPGDIIGVTVDGTIGTVVHLLGILKAGGTYMPVDPGNSPRRIVSQLEDMGAAMWLTGSGDIQKLSPPSNSTGGLIRLEPFVTRTRPQITDMDSLPFPDRSLVNYEKYMKYLGQTICRNNIALQATRGCPYRCVYCHKIWPKNHVYRSAENLFAEVKIYYDMGVRRFSFVDDLFNLNVKNSCRFFELIIKHGLKVQFFFPAGLRGDILTRELIDLMIAAGTVHVAMALETASPRLQKLIGKYLNIEKLRENMIYISEKYPQIIMDLFTMNGFPTETKEEALMNLEFIKSIKWIHFPYLFIVKVFPNTDLEKLALEHGVSKETIDRSETLAYHDIPDTLPYEKSFMLQYKSDFLNKCFLPRERLLHVLPHQMKVLSDDELVQKYSIYLPVPIKRFSDVLEFLGITHEELGIGGCVDEDAWTVPNLNEKMKKHFGEKECDENALRILLLDLTQLFSDDCHLLFDLAEAPLGLMYVLTYLDHHMGKKVKGKIARSHIDFDSYDQLKQLIDEFKPEVIGIRAMTIFKKFFHQAVAQIRHWGITVPIITGGPYATSDYNLILQDSNVDLVVLGEGEVTFSQVIDEILKNDRKLPGEEVLKELPGVAFIPESEKNRKMFTTETEKLNEPLERILKEITESKTLNLSEINMISDDEKKQIFEFNIEEREENYDF